MSRRTDVDGESRPFPVVTVALIAINLAVWLLFEVNATDSEILRLAFYPCAVVNECQVSTPWIVSWITAMFLHASWDHLLGNMLYLAIFGRDVERAFGHLQYLGLYFAGGLVATLTQTAVSLLGTSSDGQGAMVGASGAIAAVLGAYIVLYPKSKIVLFVGWFPIKIPAWVYLGFWFLYQVVEGNSVLAGTSTGGGVALFAHIGGFVYGVLAARHLVASRTFADDSDGWSAPVRETRRWR